MGDVGVFAENGFLKVDGAAPREIADAARKVLWTQLGLSPRHPESWTRPVAWTADLTGSGPFGVLVRSRRLADVLDAVCGPGGWQPRGTLGNIPVRFPVPPADDDRGWHIDNNTPRADGTWAVSGRPQTLLLLTILSEVGADDAPTRIRVGSHRDGRIPRFMAQAPVLLAAQLSPQTDTLLGSAWQR